MRVEEESGRPAYDGHQVISRHRQSRDHWATIQTGTQRYRGKDLPRDPSAQGHG